MKHHLKHMVVGGVAVLVVLLALRVNLRTAVQYAAVLACPIGMIAMMLVMNRQGHHRHGGTHADEENARKPVEVNGATNEPKQDNTVW